MNDTHRIHPLDTLRGLKVAVTGGTSGLGLALVQQLHALGARVAFAARGADAVQRVARELPGSVGIVADIADKDAIHPLALQVTGALGGLDVLINNAGALGPVPLPLLGDTECEDIEAVLQANLLGPFRLTKAMLGALAASAREGRGAAVVNVTSDAGRNAYARWGAYGMSKAALDLMTRVWDVEARGEGIRFLAFEPGDMDTPMHAAALPDTDPATLKRPAQSARELLEELAFALARRADIAAGEVA